MLRVPQNLPDNVRIVRERMRAAAQQAGRNVESVTLLAVSKGHPAEAIAAAAAAGLRNFGENYLQEALPKMAELSSLGLDWHFIGRIQGNKTAPIAENFSWAHGVDRLRIAERLSSQRPYHAPPLQICLQVNVAGEAGKAGAAPAELPALVAAVRELPRLRLRGLMCLPPEEQDPARQRHWFAETRRLLEFLNSRGAGLDTLSMGMSADLEAAISEGATLVRIGTAIFGPRPAPPA